MYRMLRVLQMSRDATYTYTFDATLTPCKGIQDSLGFWIPHRGFRIPGTGFQSLSVELGIWIPIVRGVSDSLSCIPDSKTQDSGFSSIILPDSLHWAAILLLTTIEPRNIRAVFTWLSKVIEELVWFWFYYALWLASVFTLVLVLRQSSENRSNK